MHPVAVHHWVAGGGSAAAFEPPRLRSSHTGRHPVFLAGVWTRIVHPIVYCYCSAAATSALSSLLPYQLFRLCLLRLLCCCFHNGWLLWVAHYMVP